MAMFPIGSIQQFQNNAKNLGIAMFKFKLLFFVAAFLILLTGCGTTLLSERETNPNIQDVTVDTNIWSYLSPNSKSVNTFATTASRRLVIVEQNPRGGEHGRGSIETCAEPSPDVSESFSSAVAEGFKIAAKDPNTKITAEASNQFARAIATQVAPLVYRTQGLQLYRDGLHDLCIARMNNWIDPATYTTNKTALLDAATKLITAEKDTMAAAQQAFFASALAKSETNVDNLTKLLAAIKGAAALPTPSCQDGQPATGSPAKCSDASLHQ